MDFLELTGAIALGVLSAKIAEDFFIIGMQKREVKKVNASKTEAYDSIVARLTALQESERAENAPKANTPKGVK